MSRILVVDDNEGVRTALRLLLKGAGHDVVTVDGPEAGVQAALEQPPELAILDMNFERDTTSGQEGIDLLKALRADLPDLPVIFITAWGDLERAVEAMKLGASDYVTKPWKNARIIESVETQLRLKDGHLERSAARARGGLHRDALHRDVDFSGVVGRAPAMVETLSMVADVADTEATVLLTGESGTGKSLLAEVLHRNSARADRPLVKVHIGALTPTLFESELFGHVRGAFTDAREAREGRFAAADGGTIFLDEIGTIGPTEQVKLLRVLQEGEFEPVGSSKTLRVDTRVIAATNTDLESAMQQGTFREDLYYRLNVVEIRLPPLRDRREDILILAERFLERFAEKNRKTVSELDAEARQALAEYHWPGNVRELENAVERAVVMCRDDQVRLRHLPKAIQAANNGRAGAPTASAPSSPAPGRHDPPAASGGTLEDLERRTIEKALAEQKGNISRVAAALGLSRAALYRRLDKFGLRPD